MNEISIASRDVKILIQTVTFWLTPSWIPSVLLLAIATTVLLLATRVLAKLAIRQQANDE
jgi:hypothetical protein